MSNATVATLTPYKPAYSTKRTNPVYSAANYREALERS